MSIIYDLARNAEYAYDHAYCRQKEQIVADGTMAGLIPLHHDDEGKSRGFIRKTWSLTLISIAGTQDWEDAWKDAQVEHVPFMGGGVHRGVHGEYEVVWPRIKNEVRIDKPVFVTGHSLGAGIATLVAASLRDELGVVPRVVTYGSLAPGDGRFAAKYDELVPNTIRVVHAWDIVPRWPKGCRWRHVGQELHLTDRGRRLPPIVGWLKRLLYFKKILAEDLKGVSLKDHHMGGYVKVAERYDRRYGL